MAAHWYVVHSKPNSENFLCEQLKTRAINTFNPSIRVHTINPRARKIRPFFPGYLFARVDLEVRGKAFLDWIPGASGLVSFGGEPALVPENMIFAINKRVEQINAAGGEFLETIKQGDRIVIRDGPFQGYEAIFDMRIPGSERVRVLLQFFQNRQTPVHLYVRQIQRA
jgi:transcription antitermination factor NusG